MQDAATHKTKFTENHGVNPGWGVYEERPVIPAFNGVSEIAQIALTFTLWSKVDDFLYREVGIEPLEVAKEEKKHRAVLLESETFLVALLCLINNDHYSASGLVDAMVGVNASADQRGNARKRILNRTLPICGDRYGLFDYSERHMGNTMEYSICRSARLVEFAETHLVTGFQGIIGADSMHKDKPPEKTAKKSKSAKTSKTVTRKKTASKEKLVEKGEAK